MFGHGVRGNEEILPDGRLVERVVLADGAILRSAGVGVGDRRPPVRYRREGLLGRQQQFGIAGFDPVVADDQAPESRNRVVELTTAVRDRGN